MKIGAVDIGDLDFAARRRFDRRCDIDDVVVVIIQSSDREVGLRLERLFLNRKCPSVAPQFDDAVLLRRGDSVAENSSALGPFGRFDKQLWQSMTIENIAA